jgi:hypothetical protein
MSLGAWDPSSLLWVHGGPAGPTSPPLRSGKSVARRSAVVRGALCQPRPQPGLALFLARFDTQYLSLPNSSRVMPMISFLTYPGTSSDITPFSVPMPSPEPRLGHHSLFAVAAWRINRRESRCHDRHPPSEANRRQSRSSRLHLRRTRELPSRAPSVNPTCQQRSKPDRRRQAPKTSSIRKSRRTLDEPSLTIGTSVALPTRSGPGLPGASP